MVHAPTGLDEGRPPERPRPPTLTRTLPPVSGCLDEGRPPERPRRGAGAGCRYGRSRLDEGRPPERPRLGAHPPRAAPVAGRLDKGRPPERPRPPGVRAG